MHDATRAMSRRCSLCQYERAELELPCGCAVHGRCCLLWPIQCCPWCSKPLDGKKFHAMRRLIMGYKPHAEGAS